MRETAFRPCDEEFGIDGNPADWIHIELHHPAVEAALVELGVDGSVKRIGEIDPATVAAHFDHLGSATELILLGTGTTRTRHDTADPHLAGELGLERIGNIVL